MSGRGRGRHARRLIAVAIAGCLLVDAGIVSSRVADRSDSHDRRAGPGQGQTATDRKARPVPGASPSIDQVRGAAVRAVLGRRARAILTKNRSAFLADVDPASTAFRTRQSAYFTNLVAVPLGAWTYTLEGGIEGPNSGSQFQHYFAPVWVPHIRVHYQLAGFDSVPTVGDTYFTFVKRGNRWLIGSDADDASIGFETSREIWDFGPVQVAHGRHTLVLGHPGGRVSLQSLADEIDRDIPRVSAVWGTRWAQRIVALAPSTQDEMGKLIPGSGDLDRIAAVASAEIADEHAAPVGDRVIINPANYVKLPPAGRRIVLTHETTHVATRLATGDLEPSWLVEGIADYVGYKGSGVPVTVAASELRRDLKAGKALGGLPPDKAYDGSNKALAQAYEKSWLACKYVADTFGEAALVRLYRAVGAARTGTQGAAIDRGIRGVLGLSVQTFTARWSAYVRAQLA